MSKYWYSPWDFVDDAWFYTLNASRAFLAATIVVVALTPVIVGIADGWVTVPDSPTTFDRLIWGAGSVLAVVSMLLIWSGMWRFWQRMDTSTQSQKRLWFFILLIGFWWGACGYFCFVYWPQAHKKVLVV